ncbi:hypothetical protein NDGK_02534 [Clostridiales bacterium CHKCI001]|nr:hypothetical protein NDGK_02534 [Clostridiales bacterium CHKCI001]
MKNLKLMLIMAAGNLSIILMCVFGIQSIQNKAIGLADKMDINGNMEDVNTAIQGIVCFLLF